MSETCLHRLHVVPVYPVLQLHCPVESQVVPDDPEASQLQAKYNN